MGQRHLGVPMARGKRIALVAYDHKRADLLEWTRFNQLSLLEHELRIAVVWNIPVARNRSSADLMISSTLIVEEYCRVVMDYHRHTQRAIEMA